MSKFNDYNIRINGPAMEKPEKKTDEAFAWLDGKSESPMSSLAFGLAGVIDFEEFGVSQQFKREQGKSKDAVALCGITRRPNRPPEYEFMWYDYPLHTMDDDGALRREYERITSQFLSQIDIHHQDGSTDSYRVLLPRVELNTSDFATKKEWQKEAELQTSYKAAHILRDFVAGRDVSGYGEFRIAQLIDGEWREVICNFY